MFWSLTIPTRASIITLWNRAHQALEELGAEVITVDFPVVSNYEGDRAGALNIKTRGLVSPDFLHREILDLSEWGWDDFLRTNADPSISKLADVDGALIWSHVLHQRA